MLLLKRALELTFCFSWWQMKCALYFPLEENQSQTYGRIMVTNKNLSISQYGFARRVLEVKDTKVRRLQVVRVPPVEIELMIMYCGSDWTSCMCSPQNHPSRCCIMNTWSGLITLFHFPQDLSVSSSVPCLISRLALARSSSIAGTLLSLFGNIKPD